MENTPFIASELINYKNTYFQINGLHECNFKYKDLVVMQNTIENINLMDLRVVLNKKFSNEIKQFSISFIRKLTPFIDSFKENDLYDLISNITIYASNFVANDNGYRFSSKL